MVAAWLRHGGGILAAWWSWWMHLSQYFLCNCAKYFYCFLEKLSCFPEIIRTILDLWLTPRITMSVFL